MDAFHRENSRPEAGDSASALGPVPVHASELKAAVRTELLEQRKSMSPEQRAKADATITAYAAQLCRQFGARKVAAYSPTSLEPGGRFLLEALFRETDRLLIPVSLNEGALEWGEYAGEMSLKPGTYGISEPKGTRFPADELYSVDLVFVPALGTTPDGYRIGKGGGYYDRALANSANQDIAVLVYDAEVREDIPKELHDIPANIIVSPSGITILNDN